jgi:3-dehydroquinate dehydratase-2
MKILIIHGPNLNMLGTREPELYGTETIGNINEKLSLLAKELGIQIECFQSNVEGEIVSIIQKAYKEFNGIIINPAAYTHTSVAIRDAILGVQLPTVEVHLSNIYKRETFRHHSFIAPVAIGQISGFGAEGYVLALKGIFKHLSEI